MNKIIFVLIGPSGSGKTTIGNLLKEKSNIAEIVSHTTRPRRENEKEGVHYYYVIKEEFEEIPMVEKNYYDGQFYGVSVKELNEKLKKYDILYVILDLNGFKQFKKIEKEKPNVKIISVLVKAKKETLIKRLLKRDGEKAKNRIEKLDKEIEELQKEKFDIEINTDEKIILL